MTIHTYIHTTYFRYFLISVSSQYVPVTPAPSLSSCIHIMCIPFFMFALRLDYVRFLPDFRCLLFVLQNIFGYKNEYKMRLNWNKMAPFGPFAAFPWAVALKTGMAKMEVSPQEQITNPKYMVVSAGETHGLHGDFVSFRSMCGVQSSPLVFAPNCAIV